MEALIAIALMCSVHVGSPWASLNRVDRYQANCQKDLIACYEKAFPITQPEDKNQWYGALKDCAKSRNP